MGPLLQFTEGLQRPHNRILWERSQQKHTLCLQGKVLARIEDVLPPILDEIDSALATDETPLSERPVRAAIVVAQEYATEVTGASLSEPLTQPWFGPILQFTNEWYRTKYGSLLHLNPTNRVSVFVVSRGVPLLVTIPLSITRSAPDRKHILVSFPVELEDDEDPLALASVPSTASWSQPEVDAVSGRVRKLGALVRRLAHDVNTAHRPKGAHRADGVLLAVSRAAHAVHVNDDASRRHAVWDMHFAVELAIKAFIAQRGSEPKHTHDISKLWKDAEALGLQPLLTGALERLPSQSEAVNSRYPSGPAPALSDLERLLEDSLEVATHVSMQLDREFSIRGATFTLRRPIDWSGEA